MDVPGLRIVTSPLVPKGTIFIVDETALLEPPPPVFPEPQWSAEFDRITFTAMAQFVPTEAERDPLDYGLPRSVGAWWRLAKRIFAYEFRKASGTLRRYPRDRNRHAIITGLTA